jgi:SNF family Na+-dependent transporter
LTWPVPELFIARSISLLDVIVLAIGLAFFALSVGYTIACDRL